MEHVIKVNLWSSALVLAAVIGASIVTSTVVAARAVDARAKAAARARQEITVKGSSRIRVRADMATWHAEVRGEAKALAEAYGVLDTGTKRVMAFLSGAGFAPEQVSLGAIETTTQYQRDEKGNQTHEVSGYVLTRRVTVSTPEVAKVQAAAGELTSLLKDGVEVSSDSPAFTLSKLPDLRVQLLGEAAQDARRRAEEIVKNTGGKVGPVRDAQMGVMQITQPNSTDVSAYGLYDTSTIEKDVSAVVTVTFNVE